MATYDGFFIVEHWWQRPVLVALMSAVSMSLFPYVVAMWFCALVMLPIGSLRRKK